VVAQFIFISFLYVILHLFILTLCQKLLSFVSKRLAS